MPNYFNSNSVVQSGAPNPGGSGNPGTVYNQQQMNNTMASNAGWFNQTQQLPQSTWQDLTKSTQDLMGQYQGQLEAGSQRPTTNPLSSMYPNFQGGQSPSLGRYQPPTMGDGGGWQGQGGYSYNLPNAFGPYPFFTPSGFSGAAPDSPVGYMNNFWATPNMSNSRGGNNFPNFGGASGSNPFFQPSQPTQQQASPTPPAGDTGGRGVAPRPGADIVSTTNPSVPNFKGSQGYAKPIADPTIDSTNGSYSGDYQDIGTGGDDRDAGKIPYGLGAGGDPWAWAAGFNGSDILQDGANNSRLNPGWSNSLHNNPSTSRAAQYLDSQRPGNRQQQVPSNGVPNFIRPNIGDIPVYPGGELSIPDTSGNTASGWQAPTDAASMQQELDAINRDYWNSNPGQGQGGGGNPIGNRNNNTVGYPDTRMGRFLNGYDRWHNNSPVSGRIADTTPFGASLNLFNRIYRGVNGVGNRRGP